jgi:WD40 repeat protein
VPVFSPDGARILAVADDQAVRVWDATRDITTSREITTLRGHADGVTSAVFSSSRARIVTASDDRTTRIWDAETGQEITRIALDAAVTALAVHDGDIALGDALGRIHVFEAEEFMREEGRFVSGDKGPRIATSAVLRRPPIEGTCGKRLP